MNSRSHFSLRSITLATLTVLLCSTIWFTTANSEGRQLVRNFADTYLSEQAPDYANAQAASDFSKISLDDELYTPDFIDYLHNYEFAHLDTVNSEPEEIAVSRLLNATLPQCSIGRHASGEMGCVAMN